LRAPPGKEKSQGATRKREQNTFGKKLPENPAGSCADGCANGEFPAAGHGARKKKIGDIGAGDQKNETYGCEENKQIEANVADKLFFHREDADAGILVRFGIDLGEIRGDEVHIRFGLRECNAGFETADSVHTHSHLTIEEERVVVLTDGNVDFCVVAEVFIDVMKVGRDYAGDGVRDVVELHRLTDDSGRTGEFVFPETFGDQRDGRLTWVIFVWREITTEDGIDAEDREKFGGDHFGRKAFGAAHSCEIEIFFAKSGDGRETAIFATPIQKVGIGDGAEAAVGGTGEENREGVGIGIWKRIEKNGVDGGEERRAGTNAECKREDGDGGEGGRFS